MKHYDQNGRKLISALAREGISVNDKLLEKEVQTLTLMGYVVGNGEKKPDFHRMERTLTLCPPNSVKDLKSILGIFGYYKEWIIDYKAKVSPLAIVDKFPIQGSALNAFHMLKKDLQHITLKNLDDSAPFVVETDASGVVV